MEISSNKLNNLVPFGKSILTGKEGTTSPKTENRTELPSVNAAGMSQINTNLPVSYTKIADIPVPGINKTASVFRLSNGHRVVIMPHEGQTVVTTSYGVGSMNEKDNQRGISHFIEHSVFNGSKELAPGDYDKQLALMGGMTNANTNFDETNYFLAFNQFDDKSLENGIRLNSLQTQFPTFPQDQIIREKEPVKSEIDIYADAPEIQAEYVMLKNLFGINSKCNDIIAGSKDTINALTRDNVSEYYNTWYTPDNAVTVITGDVDVNEAINLAAKYYNKNADFSKVKNRSYEKLTPITKPVRKDFYHDNAKQASISIGFPIDENTPRRDIDKLGILFNMIAAKDSKVSNFWKKTEKILF